MRSSSRSRLRRVASFISKGECSIWRNSVYPCLTSVPAKPSSSGSTTSSLTWASRRGKIWTANKYRYLTRPIRRTKCLHSMDFIRKSKLKCASRTKNWRSCRNTGLRVSWNKRQRRQKRFMLIHTRLFSLQKAATWSSDLSCRCRLLLKSKIGVRAYTGRFQRWILLPSTLTHLKKWTEPNLISTRQKHSRDPTAILRIDHRWKCIWQRIRSIEAGLLCQSRELSRPEWSN